MKKLVILIPTEGKSLSEMNQEINSAWPVIEMNLDLKKINRFNLLTNLFLNKFKIWFQAL